jgi:hypothetical protein
MPTGRQQFPQEAMQVPLRLHMLSRTVLVPLFRCRAWQFSFYTPDQSQYMHIHALVNQVSAIA